MLSQRDKRERLGNAKRKGERMFAIRQQLWLANVFPSVDQRSSGLLDVFL
jgi:hypothetical protein